MGFETPLCLAGGKEDDEEEEGVKKKEKEGKTAYQPHFGMHAAVFPPSEISACRDSCKLQSSASLPLGVTPAEADI